MALSKKSDEVTSYIYDLFVDKQQDLGLADVFYGEQNLLPNFPALEVQSGRKRRRPTTTRQFEIELRSLLTMTFGQVGQVEMSQREVEAHVEAAEDVLHADMKMGGLVVSSWVESVDPGIRAITSGHVKAVRLTWLGLSREVFSG